MILCNPHNPVGKIWAQEVLARIGHLCRKHHVVVVSDEIHCDLTASGRSYVPFASVSGEWLDLNGMIGNSTEVAGFIRRKTGLSLLFVPPTEGRRNGD